MITFFCVEKRLSGNKGESSCKAEMRDDGDLDNLLSVEVMRRD